MKDVAIAAAVWLYILICALISGIAGGAAWGTTEAGIVAFFGFFVASIVSITVYAVRRKWLVV